MKNKIKESDCPGCGKPMRLEYENGEFRKGFAARTFYCPGCKRIKVVERRRKTT